MPARLRNDGLPLFDVVPCGSVYGQLTPDGATITQMLLDTASERLPSSDAVDRSVHRADGKTRDKRFSKPVQVDG